MLGRVKSDMNESYFDGDGELSSGLAWTLFTLSGEPGYYMLYSDLTDFDDDDENRR